MDTWIIILICALSISLLLFIVVLLFTIKAHNNLFMHRFTPDPLVKNYEAEELGLKFTEIEFKSQNDTIRGYIYYSDIKHDDSIVVFCHGMWSTHKSYLQDIGYIANNGYMVMSFDYNGTNISDGKSLKGLSQSLACLDNAIKFIKENPLYKNKKIYVVGHSWGGFAAINSPQYHNDISGVVAISPFISISGVLKGMTKKPLWIAIPLFILIDRIRVGKYAYKNAIKTLKKYDGKALVIHSKNDYMVSYKYNTNILQRKINKDNVKFYINEDRFHNPHYKKESVDELVKYLSKVESLKGEEAKNYKMNVDYAKMGELDPIVMDEIINILK